MIQSVLTFLFGFLSALFLALLALPAVWKRAVRLTSRGIERSMPLSLEEIRAAQDQERAKHAVAIRRLELERDEAVAKSSRLTVDTAKDKRKLDRLAQERVELKDRSNKSSEEIARLNDQVRTKDELVTQIASKTKEAEDILAARIDELQRMGALYEEATLSSTARHVEVIARDTELERLGRQLAKLKRERTIALKQMQALETHDLQAGKELKQEHLKRSELEERLAKATAQLQDTQETLEHREHELDRLRLASGLSSGLAPGLPPEADLQVVDLQNENLKLTAEVERLKAFPSASNQGDDKLRESIHRLAAEVVDLVGRQDQHAKPIREAVEGPPPRIASQSKIISLANRIRQRAGRSGKA